MTRTVAIVQARLASQRLPGKVLFELGGMPIICLLLRRAIRARNVDEVVVSTADTPECAAIRQVSEELGFRVFDGPEDDLLARFQAAAAATNADRIVRLTADCPLVEPGLIDRLADLMQAQDLDFVTNVKPPSWPDGLDISIFTRPMLDSAFAEAALASEREHVVPWMWKHSSLEGGSRYAAANIPSETDLSAIRWTIDEPSDYTMLRAMVDGMNEETLLSTTWSDWLKKFNALPDATRHNQAIERDQGLRLSREADTTGAAP